MVFEAARRLACAYSHEWAMDADTLHDPVERAGEGPGAPMAIVIGIDALVCETPASALGRGETCPTLHVGPAGWSLVHTTGTGRTSWSITAGEDHEGPLAHVEIEIHRPAGRCLRASLALLGEDRIEVRSWQRDEGGSPGRVPEERHVDALMRVVIGLMPEPARDLDAAAWRAATHAAEDRAEALLRERERHDAGLLLLLDAWRVQLDAWRMQAAAEMEAVRARVSAGAELDT